MHSNSALQRVLTCFLQLHAILGSPPSPGKLLEDKSRLFSTAYQLSMSHSQRSQWQWRAVCSRSGREDIVSGNRLFNTVQGLDVRSLYSIGKCSERLSFLDKQAVQHCSTPRSRIATDSNAEDDSSCFRLLPSLSSNLLVWMSSVRLRNLPIIFARPSSTYATLPS